jgi:hypothetical protein
MIQPIYSSAYANRDLSIPLGNERLPRHRWYEFKEGFSAALVDEAIHDLGFRKTPLSILDPFAGSGTTLVSAALSGHNSTGIEVNPFLAFAAKAKGKRGPWRRRDFEHALGCAMKIRSGGARSRVESISTFTERPENEKWLFNRPVVRTFEAIDRRLCGFETYRDPLRLALFGALMDSCNARRDGKCLRYRADWRKSDFDANSVLSSFERRAKVVFEDISATPLRDGSFKVRLGDARTALSKLPPASFDLMITSPPYLNSFDYSDVYRPELFVGGFVDNNKELRDVRLQTIRSHVQVDWPESKRSVSPMVDPLVDFLSNASRLWSRRLPMMVAAYFDDMQQILRGAARCVRRGGKACVVVSTSAYCGMEIPVDLILADVATRSGWHLEGVFVLRQLRSAGQQWATLNSSSKPPLRESMLVLRRGPAQIASRHRPRRAR